MPHHRVRTVILLLVLHAAASAQTKREFISYTEAQPVISGMSDELPPELKAGVDESRWSAWVKAKDSGIRARLDGGEEDTLTNFLRFGVTFTREYKIDDEYLVRYGQSSLVDSFADRRANDLIHALATPGANDRLREMRAFVEKKGFSLNTPAQRQKLKRYLLENLARLRDEYISYRNTAKDERRFQLFKDRGISLDTNLWPDYQLEQSFREMLGKGALKPGSVRRVAIVGPGLDFVNKEAGNDFYPPQTIQPFAVIDSLLRLGIADPKALEVYTLDISSNVNVHIDAAKKRAAQGRPYIVQLPWNSARPMSDEFRAGFTTYWNDLGSAIGKPAQAIPVPQAAGETQTRAVAIRPDIVQRITPLDLNIVFQRLDSPREFDLIIGTSIFVYYDRFEQSLARSNVSSMLKPGGILLSNDKLPEQVPSGLQAVGETRIEMSHNPQVLDYIFWYKRGL